MIDLESWCIHQPPKFAYLLKWSHMESGKSGLSPRDAHVCHGAGDLSRKGGTCHGTLLSSTWACPIVWTWKAMALYFHHSAAKAAIWNGMFPVPRKQDLNNQSLLPMDCKSTEANHSSLDLGNVFSSRSFPFAALYSKQAPLPPTC